MKRALKWIVILFGVFLLLLVGAAVSFPYWFGSALKTAGQRFGASFAKYEKLGNGRFALTDVARTNNLFDLRISRVEGYLPYDWYRRIKATNRAGAFLEVNGWRIVVHPRDSADSSPSSNTVYGRWKEVERLVKEGREWLPKATLLNGSVEIKGREYTFPVITWAEGKLDVGGVWPISAVPFEIKGKLTGETPYQISYLMTPLDLRVRLQAAETNGALNTKVALFYKENRVDLVADFLPNDRLLPSRATLKAPNLKIPGELVRIDKYNELTGSLSVDWATNTYVLKLMAHADPLVSSRLPAADIQVSATGNTNRVRIEQLRSTAPGLEASISDPIEMNYQGRLISERSEFKIAADLEKLPWLKLKGQIDATLLLKQGEKFPTATIRAAGTRVQFQTFEAEQIEMAGALNWPAVENFSFIARLPGDGSIQVTGGGNLEARTVEKTVIRVEAPFLALGTNLDSSKIKFSGIQLNAEVSGALSNLSHAAEFEIRDFSTPQTEPIHLEGRWKARQFTFDEIGLRARAGPAGLRVIGSGFNAGLRTNLVIQELTLEKGDEPYLKLLSPVTISLLPNQRFELSSLLLTGNQRSLGISGSLRWPSEGQIHLNATNISPALVQNFVTHSLRDLDVEQLALSAGWSNSPLAGKLTGRVSVAEEHFARIGATVAMEFAPSKTEISEMHLWDRTGEIVTAKGNVPLSLNPISAPRVEFSRTMPLDFELRTTTNRVFWDWIGGLAKLGLTNPAVELVVHGTAESPRGEFHLVADAIKLGRTNREFPALGPVNAHLTLNEEALEIRDFSLRILDQPVEVKGNLRLGTNFWSQRREEVLAYALDNAALQIDAPDVKLAPFTAYLPKYLSPQGNLAMKVAMKPGRNFDGHINVEGVETRPLPRIGVIQSIQASVDLHGQEMNISDLSGVIGGERLKISGRVDVSPNSVAKGYPDVNLAITGKNIPLARNPDVILRSDLSLQVRNGPNQAPVISGEAILRDSFLLRDISTLVPGRVSRPERRPPYFSIEQDPVDEWKLEVRVRGDRFMRVRSPFFQGIVSANFNVTGTALEPVALGEASIGSGSIIFPFATLEVRQALVSLTTDDPFLPHIFAVAEGRAFGFDIRLDAKGPADQPVIQFSSVPALSSEQIVLMLTTGQIPREDFNFSNQDRVSKLALFLGKSLVQKLRPGKPAEEKLTIRSGQDITEQGRQTYEVEYKLSPRWSLVGEYDRFGALNANVKWRLVSR